MYYWNMETATVQSYVRCGEPIPDTERYGYIQNLNWGNHEQTTQWTTSFN